MPFTGFNGYGGLLNQGALDNLWDLCGIMHLRQLSRVGWHLRFQNNQLSSDFRAQLSLKIVEIMKIPANFVSFQNPMKCNREFRNEFENLDFHCNISMLLSWKN